MHLSPALLRDIFQWDIRNWSKALALWQQAIDKHQPKKALAIGEREGGLSLWLAFQGLEVTCTDLGPLPEATRELHRRHGMDHRITYASEDATALSMADASYDLVIFKSVIGALGSKERQMKAISEMQRVLRPGGVLLFAENLGGTQMHRWLRKRFVAWDRYWRYLSMPADRDLFAGFEQVEYRTHGLLANLGRSEGQRDLLARFDAFLGPLTPRSWHYIVYGYAIG